MKSTTPRASCVIGDGFLTVVASGVHHKLFEAPETLQNIIENIAIPNLQFRTDDEEILRITLRSICAGIWKAATKRRGEGRRAN